MPRKKGLLLVAGEIDVSPAVPDESIVTRRAGPLREAASYLLAQAQEREEPRGGVMRNTLPPYVLGRLARDLEYASKAESANTFISTRDLGIAAQHFRRLLEEQQEQDEQKEPKLKTLRESALHLHCRPRMDTYEHDDCADLCAIVLRRHQRLLRLIQREFEMRGSPGHDAVQQEIVEVEQILEGSGE